MFDPPTEPDVPRTSGWRRGLISGAVLGALAASVLGVGALAAGAQGGSDPAPAAGSGGGVVEVSTGAMGVDEEGLSEADQTQLKKFEACMDKELGDPTADGPGAAKAPPDGSAESGVVVFNGGTGQPIELGHQPAPVMVGGPGVGVEVGVEGGATEIDLGKIDADPAFEAAEKRCEKLLPEGASDEIGGPGEGPGAETPPPAPASALAPTPASECDNG